MQRGAAHRAAAAMQVMATATCLCTSIHTVLLLHYELGSSYTCSRNSRRPLAWIERSLRRAFGASCQPEPAAPSSLACDDLSWPHGPI